MTVKVPAARNRPATSPRRSSVHAEKSAARLAAVQGLYEIELTGAAVDAVLIDFLHDRWAGASAGEAGEAGKGAIDKSLFSDLVKGAAAQRAKLDEMIDGALTGDVPPERMQVVLRAILRAAVHELGARETTPPRVVIDEYVDIAHAFFDGQEPALVNAVLDRLGRVLRPREMELRDGDE